MFPVRIFTNARFLAPGAGMAASTLIERGGRILAIGGDELRSDFRAEPGRAEEIDLEGCAVIPGPVDAHCHLVSYGMMAQREADLRGVGSLHEIASRLRGHAERLGIRAGDGRWLLGRGFEQDLLAEGRWPARTDLDALIPGVPVRITRVCGHALVASTLALLAAGIDPSETHPGFPSGVLTEGAMAPVHAAVPPPAPADWLAAARWACRELARVGFVGAHSLMAHGREMRALVDLHRQEGLPVRVEMQPPFAMLPSLVESGIATGFGDDFLTYGAVKLFSDGSLGARTAAMHAPYSDDPSTTGQLIYSPEELSQRVAAVTNAGLQVCVHAIGDRAMDLTLDAIEAAQAQGPTLPWPARIEHASVVNPSILARMAAAGVAAAIQPQFAWSDYWAPERLGAQRAKGCYAFRSLHAAGVPMAGSTDSPVEALDAMAAIGRLVHRPAWSPNEGLPLEQALRLFSEGSYRIRGLPADWGRLVPGGRADFVALESDPSRVTPAEIERIGVSATVVHGRFAYRADLSGSL